MPVTSAEVARAAGVSRATVSYVINGKDAHISEETRKAVRDAAAALGYEPQAAGRTLVTGKSNIILLPIPLTPNAAFLPQMAQIESLAVDRGLTLLLMPPTTSTSSLVKTLRSVRPYLVVTISPLPREQQDALRNSECDWLDVAARLSQPHGPHWQTARHQARHLDACGYAHLAYAREAQADGDAVQWAREQGFLEECAALGRPEPLTITIGRDPRINMQKLASLPTGTGVAAFNDDTAAEVIYAAHLSERAIPDDLGVIGVDDTSITHTTMPTLSSVGFAGGLHEAFSVFLFSDAPDQEIDHEVMAMGSQYVAQRGSTRQAASAGEL